MTKFSKAIWAAVSSAVTLTSAAVAAADPHTLGAIHTPGWLTIIGGVIAVTGGVFGFANTP